MPFSLPSYHPPDFSTPSLTKAPIVRFEPAPCDGVAPEEYHATSVFPEYLHLRPGEWCLLKESRMDCVVVHRGGDLLEVTEFRHLRKGDMVACGRGENGEDGIFIHIAGFLGSNQNTDKFSFRTQFTRETSFSVDYDELYNLLKFERDSGFILWVLGPALAFDRDARQSFALLVERGFVHGLLAGNALPTHDLEGSLYGTSLGQEIYSKRDTHLGHYHHLDALNRLRALGSMRRAVHEGEIRDGIMRTIIEHDIPYVLAGSIRDDGPMPEVISDTCKAQDAMRALARRATTVVALASQLHTIATGNMTPSYHVSDALVRPVYFYIVDMSEFAVGKLANRGTLTARAILTNVQDFVVTLERGLG
jgi:hypothetical protein